MKVDIYRSKSDKSKFLFVPAGTDFTAAPVIDVVEDGFTEVTVYRKDVELSEGMISLNSAQAQQDISDRGYHVTTVIIKTDVMTKNTDE